MNFYVYFLLQLFNRHMQSIYINELKRGRTFGKEISNVADLKLVKKDLVLNYRSKKNPLSHRGISEDLSKRNSIPVCKSARNLINHSTKTNITVKEKNTSKIQIHVDKKSQKNPQDVPQYFEQCFNFMLQKQRYNPQLTSYMVGKQLNDSMRVVLLGWILDIHERFKMFPATLFITVSLIDRYLAGHSISRSKLQLVGATCLYIASKYEDTYQVPELSEMVKLCAKVYTKQQFLEMEASILKFLNFDIIVDSGYKFLQPLCNIQQIEKKWFCLSRYILQLSLFDLKSYKYKPSILASASVYLTNKFQKKSVCWSLNLSKITGYSQQEIKPCAKEMLLMLEKASNNQMLKSIKKKFAMTSFYEVSKLKLQKKSNQQKSANESI